MGNERLLFVDDERILVEISESMLQRYGYEVAGFSDSMEALRAFELQPDGSDVIMTDTIWQIIRTGIFLTGNSAAPWPIVPWAFLMNAHSPIGIRFYLKMTSMTLIEQVWNRGVRKRFCIPNHPAEQCQPHP